MANRFWVGGAGTWNTTSTANWSTSTGGASGASAPGVADAAIFDANSGGGAVVLGENVSCLTLNMSAFTGSLNYVAYKITLVGNAATIFTGGTGYSVSGTPLIEATYAGSTGTRTITMGATTEANAVSLNITAGTDLVALSSGSAFKNLNFTGYSGTISNATGKTYYGNLTVSAGMTFTAGTGVQTFAATSGTQQITTNGKTLDFPLTQNGVGGTVQLQDNLTMGSTRTYTLTNGALDLSSGNRTLSTGLFSSSNSNTRSIAFGTGNITVTGNSATILSFSTATNFTYTGASNIICSYAGSTGTRTITPPSTNAVQSNAMNIAVTAGTDTVAVSGSARFNTFDLTGFAGTLTSSSTMRYFQDLVFSSGMTLGSIGGTFFFIGTSRTQKVTTAGKAINTDITIDAPSSTIQFQDALNTGNIFTITNGTVQLKNGVTSTVGSFVANNSNVKFLQSTTPGAQATLSQASGTVNVVDLTIRDINAVGGASWNAYTDFENTDAGNNDGWNFSLSPPYSTAELPITLRPFTQPRRF
jgi:hypothetical protein